MSVSIFDLHSDIFKVLANTKRLQIVHLIRDRELTVSGMTEMLGLPQANLSQHLMVLRDNHIVKTRKEGTKIYYSLTDIKLLQASDLIREFLKNTHRNKNIAGIFEGETRFEDYLKEHRDPVCGMYISTKDAVDHIEYDGSSYYFCAMGCKKRFKENPNYFLREEAIIG